MPAVTASMVADLRDRTGMSLADVKKALDAAGGDVDKAEQLMQISHRAGSARTELTRALSQFPGFEDGYATAQRQQEFGRRLRQIREERNLSQSVLAELAKVDQGDVSRFEAGKWGKRGVSFEMLERILPILGLRLEHQVLFADNEKPSAQSKEWVAAMGYLL